MNGLSINEICCLFCVPPCPSSIVAKLAFLPPQPTYKLIVNDLNEQTNTLPINNNEQDIKELRTNSCICTKLFRCHRKPKKQLNFVYTNAQLELGQKAEWQFGPRELEKLEVFSCKTDQGHKIACLYIRCVNTPKYTILFSHGNAVDIGQMSSFYFSLGSKLDCNIFTYDYSGYGESEGRPTEKNLYSDVQAAWNALRTRYGISPSNIILYGQSIGTVPTVDLASKYDCAGVILHAPLMSGMRVAFNTNRTWCCDAFPSIEKVNRIRSLVLVIHGTDDEVIDISHGIAIHEKCLNPADPLYVEGAGHNDVEIFPQYFERLKNFINSEILNYQTKVIGSDFKKSSFNNKEISSSSNNKNANGFNNEPSELQKQPCLDNSLNE